MIRRTAALIGLAGLAGLVLVGLLAGHESMAQPQVQVATACYTQQGVCPVNPMPVNLNCQCRNDPGRVGFAPRYWGNMCATPQGYCAFWPYPTGTQCQCNGVFGNIVPPTR